MDKKNLVVNCAFCDMRKITLPILEQYESIKIHAATIATSTESKELMAGYHVSMNAAAVMDVDCETEFIHVNGSYSMVGGHCYNKKVFLMVNGSMTVEKDVTEVNFRNIVGIVVNGTFTYPSGLREALPPFQVNGSVETYPSDAVLLNDWFTLDKYFVMRAQGGKYFARNQVIIEDRGLNLQPLLDKNALLVTGKAVIAEELLEKALSLFDEQVLVEVIPAGHARLESCTLTEEVICQKGSRLYVDGDLTIMDESIPALGRVDCVKIKGNIVTLPRLRENLKNFLLEYKGITLVKGRRVKDKDKIKIDRHMLERNSDGICFADCCYVYLDKELVPDEIENLLEIVDCGIVYCTPEQRSSIEMISSKVGSIDDSGTEEPEDRSGMQDSFLGGLQEQLNNCEMINTACYEF